MKTELKQVRHLIAMGWMQRHWSNAATPWHKDASKWCLHGAFAKVFGFMVESTHPLLQKVMQVNGITNLSRWNDLPGRTQAEVLAALDKTITSLE